MIEEHEVSEMRAQGDWQAYRKAVAVEVLTMRSERRKAVLAHPDLAEKLMDPPLKMSSPEKWTGYVPSPTVEAKHHQDANPSPYRAQLVAIVRVAEQRDGRNYGLGLTGE
jgi:hypothetical protein